MSKNLDTFGTRTEMTLAGQKGVVFSLPKLAESQGFDLRTMPFSMRVLLENMLRNEDGVAVKANDITKLLDWNGAGKAAEIAYMPSRVVLQDFTGVPAVVDLAAMRDGFVGLGGDGNRIQPGIPADLVIDHSVQVDRFGTGRSEEENVKIEYERNRERYEFLRWGQTAFDNFRVVPPGTGIVHQVNLEYLSPVVFSRTIEGVNYFYPDSVVGTDSHTTMINGLGVFGWGVGGIEAEAVMMGQPYFMLTPEVVGFRLTGELATGATATDLVLTVVEMLRELGVVGKFVEFFGPGLGSLPLADRATLANMAPEYGATMGFCPLDDQAMKYLELSGRPEASIALTQEYAKKQGLYWNANDPEPTYSDVLELDMGTVEPSLAGPKRPQDRITLSNMKSAWNDGFDKLAGRGQGKSAKIDLDGSEETIGDGSVVIAAITSCTNTSNPSVMVAAGLLARKARERGLQTKSWVKTSLAPGSQVVAAYLEASKLQDDLDALRFNVVGFGCTTCIGNSGPLPDPVAGGVVDEDLVVASVLSGNRNFEGRINPHVRANYLASPPLVVAYALAGTVNIDLTHDPIGQDADGNDVMLSELWPTAEEVNTVIASSLNRAMFEDKYSSVFDGDEQWQAIEVSGGDRYSWSDDSTYIANPPFFEGMTKVVPDIEPIKGLRCLALFGDSVTTDHISPAGSIAPNSPAGLYLQGKGIAPKDFNSYGSRRGNHEVMMRGTFANIRIRNQMVPGVEGGYTLHVPSGEQMAIYDAAMRYRDENTSLVVIGGTEYGTGSSRDWAAKGTFLLGVKAVICTSFERIHRSNLVGMGVLPLQFADGTTAETLGLDGSEIVDIDVSNDVKPRSIVKCTATRTDGSVVSFDTVARLDTPIDVSYYRHGGILQYVLRDLA